MKTWHGYLKNVLQTTCSLAILPSKLCFHPPRFFTSVLSEDDIQHWKLWCSILDTFTKVNLASPPSDTPLTIGLCLLYPEGGWGTPLAVDFLTCPKGTTQREEGQRSCVNHQGIQIHTRGTVFYFGICKDFHIITNLLRGRCNWGTQGLVVRNSYTDVSCATVLQAG